jgi:hypothetical protein
MATWKQIEARRELRLWIKEVIVPTVIGGAALMSVPEVRCWVSDKSFKIKRKVRSIFKK